MSAAGADRAEARVREMLAQLAGASGASGASAGGPGADWEVVPCDPALADTAAFCEAYGYGLDESANTIVVVGKGDPVRYAACLVLASTRLDVNRAVRQRLGVKKASFASADETLALSGQVIGGVTVFGLPEGLPIWVDARVMARPRVVVGGGSRSCKVVCTPEVLRLIPGLEVVDDLALESPR